MNKSIRKPIRETKKPIQVNRKGGKKDNIVYLKQRYSYHYRKGQWNKAEEYNQYTLSNYNVNLRDWMEGKEANKIKNKNTFGFEKPKRLRYG
tara:strand:+ start:880 stop:1155 length:276 start_codon:yes stop_codon:yes gene_type:complete